MSFKNISHVICIGEALWDSLPNGLFPGGAPFNVAYHLHQLQVPVDMVSRVGNDRLGHIFRQRMTEKGLSDRFIQTDHVFETGWVNVVIDASGNASYTIAEPVAWDHIEPPDQFDTSSTAVVFGTLGQRQLTSRSTIRDWVHDAPVAIYDINLRPPYDQMVIVKDSLEMATITKMNAEEFDSITAQISVSGTEEEKCIQLAELFDLSVICITKAENGAALWMDGVYETVPGQVVDVKDTVGAGDAFLAAFIFGMMKGLSPRKILENANAVGGIVAGHHGPTPVWDTRFLLTQ